MSEQTHFRTVMRGYEPSQVEQALREQAEALREARQRVDDATRHGGELERRVAELEVALRHRDETDPVPLGPAAEPSFGMLGARVAQILELAQAEAEELRDNALADAQERARDVEEHAATMRLEADRYTEQTRGAADTEAAHVVEDARRRAEDVRDSADRDAVARREEAEALYEGQRARAAQAAADFETTLAQRRDRAERDFTGRAATAESQLAELRGEAERVQAESDRSLAEASRRASRMLDEAQATADEIVAEAKTRAERIRAESDRELVAATQRRDSINAQLVNVRQMLATLSGGTVPSDPFDRGDDDTPVAMVEGEEMLVVDDDAGVDDETQVYDLTRDGEEAGADEQATTGDGGEGSTRGRD